MRSASTGWILSLVTEKLIKTSLKDIVSLTKSLKAGSSRAGSVTPVTLLWTWALSIPLFHLYSLFDLLSLGLLPHDLKMAVAAPGLHPKIKIGSRGRFFVSYVLRRFSRNTLLYLIDQHWVKWPRIASGRLEKQEFSASRDRDKKEKVLKVTVG